MDDFVKQILVSETIFGDIKKPPDIICVVVSLDCVYSPYYADEKCVFYDFEY